MRKEDKGKRLKEQTDVGEKASTQVKQSIEDARIIEAQGTEEEPDGSPKLRKGVASNRRISIEDKDMRHGRKSRMFWLRWHFRIQS